MDPNKIKSIIDCLIPKDLTNVQSFMGTIGYYIIFIDGFSRITNLITSLQKKGNNFFWDQKCEENFNKLKE